MTKLWCVKVLEKCYIHLNEIVFRSKNLESSYQRHIDGCEQLMNPSDDPVAISHRISFSKFDEKSPSFAWIDELQVFNIATLTLKKICKFWYSKYFCKYFIFNFQIYLF